jgi:hypothetical protein
MLRDFRLPIIFVVLIELISAPTVHAAQIKIECTKYGCHYSLDGEIAQGDFEGLRSLLKQKRTEIMYVHLNSPGGDLQEALRIAELVHNAFLYTTVRVDIGDPADRIGHCASACFLVWVGGVYRDNSPLFYTRSSLSPFFLHRPHFDASRYSSNDAKVLAQETARLNSLVREYLSTNGVPQRIIDEMMKRSSVDAYRLTREEADSVAGYAAWYEEWLLARCGANPAKIPKNESIENMMNFTKDPKWQRWIQCHDKSILEARGRFLASLN